MKYSEILRPRTEKYIIPFSVIPLPITFSKLYTIKGIILSPIESTTLLSYTAQSTNQSKFSKLPCYLKLTAHLHTCMFFRKMNCFHFRCRKKKLKRIPAILLCPFILPLETVTAHRLLLYSPDIPLGCEMFRAATLLRSK